ncbi:hypothetical protein EFK68_04375 [Pseudomonas aeruginosa]|nr:hypothetical protein [Pseudomonas aeruginosa]EKX3430981.1 hypothetical protein [Pseudomonas aeruginosa]RNF58601.1 hypothetical protein EFK68_04375 [Pseudomonas aeruginosa]HBO1619150.1 hypothetical protein [Pseudomonas aeruginosa]HCA5864512.1 hypothetical protein [Pseudomonas aeruginosa]
MGNNTANRPLRKRRHLATRSSLDSAEMAIVDGRRTIGEISAMVEIEGRKGGAFDDPFPDDVLEVAQPAPLTVGAECRAMFGMNLGPLMACIGCLGSIAGVILGFMLDGTPLQKNVTAIIGSLF